LQLIASASVCAELLDLHQISLTMPSPAGRNSSVLRRAPVVDVADLVYARDGAVGRAGFLGEKLALDDSLGVLRDRNAGIATLLAAVADDAVLIHIQIA